ncbi:hypothetical protein [Helicobacter sp. 23-1046]
MQKLSLVFLVVGFLAQVAFGYDEDLALPNNSYYIPYQSTEIHSSDLPHIVSERVAKSWDYAYPESEVAFSDYDKAYSYWCDEVAEAEADLRRSNEGITNERVKQYTAGSLARCKAELKAMKENPANQSFWHRFLIDCPKDSSQAECKRRFEAAKNLFSPFDKSSCSGGSGDSGDTCCYFAPYTQAGYVVRHCFYRVNKPLHIKGKVTLWSDSFSSDDGYLEFEPYDKNLDFLAKKRVGFFVMNDSEGFLKHTKFIYDNLPKWYQQGLSGSVSFEIEFDFNFDKRTKQGTRILGNMIGDVGEDRTSIVDTKGLAMIRLQKYYGGADNIFYANNFTINKKINENPLNPQKYEKYSINLKTKDSFVNLRDEPNGKVLAKIYKKDKDKFVLAHNHWQYTCNGDKSVKINEIEVEKWSWLIDMNLSKIIDWKQKDWATNESEKLLVKLKNLKNPDKWVRVIYFQPNAKSANDAIVGYIHKSQLDVEDYEAECEI